MKKSASPRAQELIIGKLAKFAAGHESVHSTNSSQDFAFLAETARAAGADGELIERISRANTAQEASEMVGAGGPPEFFQLLCRKAWDFAASLVGRRLTLEVYLTRQNGDVLGQYAGSGPGDGARAGRGA